MPAADEKLKANASARADASCSALKAKAGEPASKDERKEFFDALSSVSININHGRITSVRSKLEKERNLEQMRAIENNLIIKVGLCDSQPLSVDTEEDLKKIRKEMR